MANKINYSSATKQVIKYLNKNIPTLFARETKSNKIFSVVEKLKNEAIILLKEMKKKPRTEKGKLIKFQAAMKSYIFVEKVREYFTGEEIQYLMMLSSGENIDMKVLTLKDIIPLMRPGSKGGSWTKIDIHQIKRNLNKIQSQFTLNNKYKQQILSFYQILETIPGTQRGYAYEAAVKAMEEINLELEENPQSDIIRNSKKLEKKLLDVYKNQIGQTPFYVKGDIETTTFLKAFGINEKINNILFQLKNLASSNAAQIATYLTLTNLLIYFIYILNSTSIEQEVKTLFEKFFKEDKKISSLISKNIKTEVENIVSQFEKSIREK